MMRQSIDGSNMIASGCALFEATNSPIVGTGLERQVAS